jgi:hypothetical protein
LGPPNTEMAPETGASPETDVNTIWDGWDDPYYQEEPGTERVPDTHFEPGRQRVAAITHGRTLAFDEDLPQPNTELADHPGPMTMRSPSVPSSSTRTKRSR